MPSGKVSRVSPNQGKRDMIVRGCEDSQCVRLAAKEVVICDSDTQSTPVEGSKNND
jgi:hypothetical protein